MVTRALPREDAEKAIGALEQAMREGYAFPGVQGQSGAVARASAILGLKQSTLHSRIVIAERDYGLTPEKPAPVVEQKPEYVHNSGPPRVSVKATGQAYRIVGIGDTHDHPGLCKDRFKWIARYVGETQPDRVVHIGDLSSWDSMSRHDAPGSLSQKLRPSFQNDLESTEEALAAYDAALGDTQIRHDITLGNHEERIRIFEGGTAELEGALWPQFADVMARYNWRMTPYRQYLFIAGVGFTHVPQTLREQPYNGKTLNPLANDLTYSLVFGHSHRGAFLRVPKIGPSNSVELLNLGSAMPDGYYASYNQSQQGAASFGIYDFTVQGGHITGHHFIPMGTLEERFA